MVVSHICQRWSRTPPFDRGARSCPFHRLPWPWSTVPTDSFSMHSWESAHWNKNLGPSNLNSIKADQPIETSANYLLPLLDWSNSCNNLCPKMCRPWFYCLKAQGDSLHCREIHWDSPSKFKLPMCIQSTWNGNSGTWSVSSYEKSRSEITSKWGMPIMDHNHA